MSQQAQSSISTNSSDEEIAQQILLMGKRARAASHELVKLTTEQKNAILRSMAAAVRADADIILSANAKDIEAAEAKGLSKPMVERLRLTPTSLEGIAAAIEQVATLPDPVGEILSETTRPNGLQITKVRVPIGVIGIIYESRPNVTSDAAVLCFKTGNATILRGGSEAFHSNTALANALQKGGETAGLPPHSIQLVPFTDRSSVDHLARMDQYLDLIIPRGGQALVERVVSTARMPVLKHYHGVCHVYLHREADPGKAVNIVVNAKTHKPGVCNALETLLVDRSIASSIYPALAEALAAKNVEIRGDAEVLAHWPNAKPVSEEDWTTEYLDLILSVKTVDSLKEAIDHINHYGSHHTDAIVTENAEVAKQFLHETDTAVAMWNASTRFNDGGEFGFGAEIGISTDKLHARGPMGLAELCSYKYLVTGNGQIR